MRAYSVLRKSIAVTKSCIFPILFALSLIVEQLLRSFARQHCRVELSSVAVSSYITFETLSISESLSVPRSTDDLI